MRLYLLFAIVFGGLFVGAAQDNSPNIILMIGDGTGLTQITAGMYANGNKTNLESFSTIGLAKTHSSNSLVTDSAASGTAMASGVKTLNGVIGISSRNIKTPSILEYSKEQ
jgi:alkaline phosphatase